MLPPNCWQFLRLRKKGWSVSREPYEDVFHLRGPNLLVREARLRDLSIVPAVLEGHNYRWYAESIVFGSGRPVLILPPRGRTPERPLDTIAIAWDGSRPAARAVADAFPILERAKEVHILTVLNEKELISESPASELSSIPGTPRNCCQTGKYRCSWSSDRRSAEAPTSPLIRRTF